MVWRLLATTGMRRGEALALRWRDVELLTADEQAAYQLMLRHEHGDRVRLEQERIRFSAVERAASGAFPAT